MAQKPKEDPKPDVAAEAETEQPRRRRRRRRRRRHGGGGGSGGSFRQIERMIAGLGGSADALLATLGSAPAFATAESMLTASQAQGQMMLGAVANQQRLNTLALIATGGCVMQMLRLGDNLVEDDEDFDPALAQMMRGMTGG